MSQKGTLRYIIIYIQVCTFVKINNIKQIEMFFLDNEVQYALKDAPHLDTYLTIHLSR